MTASHRIIKTERDIVTAEDGSQHSATTWALYGPPANPAEDLTMERVSAKYLTRSALLAAIERGDA